MLNPKEQGDRPVTLRAANNGSKPKAPTDERPEWEKELHRLKDELLDLVLLLRNKRGWGRPYKQLGKPLDLTKENCSRCLGLVVIIMVALDIFASLRN
ncbi:MAG: hypothetical protein SFV17_11030 [Candidatus Obscuribacter sp.]|nr:hypothetical protein [Candidatus Obscuribacter sp.]